MPIPNLLLVSSQKKFVLSCCITPAAPTKRTDPVVPPVSTVLPNVIPDKYEGVKYSKAVAPAFTLSSCPAVPSVGNPSTAAASNHLGGILPPCATSTCPFVPISP